MTGRLNIRELRERCERPDQNSLTQWQPYVPLTEAERDMLLEIAEAALHYVLNCDYQPAYTRLLDALGHLDFGDDEPDVDAETWGRMQGGPPNQ